MATAVDICNMALSQLGDEATVTSIDPPEGSAQAEHCQRFYPMALAEILASHHWTFAKRRTQLAKLADVPVGQEDFYYYPLPADCIELISVGTSQLPPNVQPTYTIEQTDAGQAIVAKYKTLWVLYITSDVKETQFPPLFTTALTHKLASLLAGPIIASSSADSYVKKHLELYTFYLTKAIDKDARQVLQKQKYVSPFLGFATGEISDVFD